MLKGQYLYSEGKSEAELTIGAANETGICSEEAVFLDIKRNCTRTTSDVFDEYASAEEDYGFTKTKVPVRLLKHEGEDLVSRSQAKRLIARFDKFKEVILDFEDIKRIGQAFADEIFRVFHNQHPTIKLIWINTSDEIEKVIKHVMSSRD